MSDFLIVGAGINGLLVARELARAGASLILVERGEVARESSWAGGGIVSPLYPWRYPAAITALASWAQSSYPALAGQLLEETGQDVELRHRGLLMLDADDEEQALAWAAAHERPMQRLDAEAIHGREAALAADVRSGLWMPEVAQVRNPRLCAALRASLAAMPRVSIRTGLEVVELTGEGGRVRGLRARQLATGALETIEADALIVTAGAWTQDLLASIGRRVPVAPVKGQMLLFKLGEPPIDAIVLRGGRYLIPRRDGHVLAGSTLELAGFDKQITQPARDSLLASARSILPALADHEPVAQWAGLRPGSADGLPYIGAVPGWEGLFVNAGQYRNGLVLAPASARLLADLLLGRPPIVDPTPYLPGRAEPGAPASV